MHPRCLLPAWLLVGAAVTALAQPQVWNNDRDRGDHGPRVILYEDADYRGAAMVVYPGDAVENFSGMRFENGRSVNDQISSIRVEGGAVVIVYADANFRGPALRLTESVRDLSGRFLRPNGNENWNDRISSLRVEGQRDRHGPPDNRRVDSDLIIKRSFQDVLLRDPGEADFRECRSYIIDQGWTEAMLRDHLRQSEEFRREGVDRIVRRAFLDILGRDPGPEGFRVYRRAILEKGWSESDLRDELRRSAEYRSKHPPN
jgi:hypothetical protein